MPSEKELPPIMPSEKEFPSEEELPSIMPSEEEFWFPSHDVAVVTESLDEAIRDLRLQLEAAQQTCSFLGQRYEFLSEDFSSEDFSRLRFENAQFSASVEQRLSEFAVAHAEKHWLHLKARDWAEAKKELQEERANVRTLMLEKEKAMENSMKQAQDMSKDLVDAWQAVALAESKAAVAKARCSELEAKIACMEKKDFLMENEKCELQAQKHEAERKYNELNEQVVLITETFQELINTSKELSSLKSEVPKLQEMLDAQIAKICDLCCCTSSSHERLASSPRTRPREEFVVQDETGYDVGPPLKKPKIQ